MIHSTTFAPTRVSGALALAFSLAACSGGTSRDVTAPTAPTVPAIALVAAPVPPIAAGYNEVWQLTTVVIETTGTGASCDAGFLGEPVTGQMALGRSASSVKLLYWLHNWPTDDIEYSGPMGDGAFTAEDMTSDSAGCQSTVAGHFSADGNHVDAVETWRSHFPAGDGQVSISWSADRQITY